MPESLIKKLLENFNPSDSEELRNNSEISEADVIAIRHMGDIYTGNRIAIARERGERIYFG